MGSCWDFFWNCVQTQVKLLSKTMTVKDGRQNIWTKCWMKSSLCILQRLQIKRLRLLLQGFHIKPLCSVSLTLRLLTLRWFILFDIQLPIFLFSATNLFLQLPPPPPVSSAASLLSPASCSALSVLASAFLAVRWSRNQQTSHRGRPSRPPPGHLFRQFLVCFHSL